jgi:hypothetical protein
MSKSKNPKAEVMDDAGFGKLKPRLEAIPANEVVLGGANYDDATSRALGVLDALEKDPSLAQALRLLPKEHFDPTHLDELPMLVAAVIYAHDRSTTVAATTSEALVPVALVDEATQLRSRLLKLVDYQLGDDPDHAREIADIRAGGGHLDLAKDLARLRLLLIKYEHIVEQDTKYKATDPEEAARLSLAIRTAYNSSNSNPWADYTRRAYTLLAASNDEVRTAAQFVFRHAPARSAVFVALRAAGRRKANGSGDEGPSEPGAGGEGGATPAGGAGPA